MNIRKGRRYLREVASRSLAMTKQSQSRSRSKSGSKSIKKSTLCYLILIMLIAILTVVTRHARLGEARASLVTCSTVPHYGNLNHLKVEKRLYRDLNSFLKEKFGEKVYKVSINPGFGCPNLDGTISECGCTFCNNDSLRPLGFKDGESVEEQLARGIEYMKKRHKAHKFIAYLQPYTNTYADPSKLTDTFQRVVSRDDVVGLAVSTRPDCIDERKLECMREIQKKRYVWLELGLQSVFDVTLKKINRGHTYSDFLKAYGLARNAGIPVCVHVVFGLPGETRDMMLNTVRVLSDLGIFGVKIHAIHVIKNSGLYNDYLHGRFKPISMDTYVSLVADGLEMLNEEIVVHRLTGEGPRDITVAPDWIFNKLNVIDSINKEMERRDSYQGAKFKLGK